MSNAHEHTFVFADLAGFTALTEAHGDERAADIAMEFCRELNRLLPEDAEDLKMLGDACLLRIGDAADAVQLGVQLTRRLAPRHDFPEVRIGMHTGQAVRRGSDWFGSTVNTAARVAELAGPGDVLLTAATRAAAGSPPAVRLEDCGTHELRHIGDPAHLYRVRSETTAEHGGRWVIDPVCRMRLDTEQAATSVTEDSAEHFFCSSLCAGQFARSPERYLRDVGRARL
jgi:adenylate cyclase